MKKINNFKKEIEDVKICDSISSFIKWGHYIGNIDNLISKNQVIKINNPENRELVKIRVSRYETFKSLFSDKDSEEVNKIPNYPDFRSFLEKDESLYNVIKYTNSTPLILDSLKKIFYLGRCDYVVGEIEGVKYLIYKNYNEVSLVDYVNRNGKSDVILQIQRIFVFNWIMCVKNGVCPSYENNIYLKSINPYITDTIECKHSLQVFSINEHNFIYDTERNISSGILTKWFDGKTENFYNIAKNLLEGINVEVFRGRFKEVIQFYNPDYMAWVNSVYDRMNYVKNM